MTYTDRNQFLEKFQKQHGLSVSNSNIFDSSKSKITTVTEGEGRWEYLYQLEKLKKMKLQKLRVQKEEIEFEKEYKECTFTPKLNNYKGNVYQGLSNFTNNNNISNANLSSNMSTNNLNRSRIDTNGDIHQRQKAWDSKKNMKIEIMKQKNIEKEYEECKFKPRLNPPDQISRLETECKATDLVVDPGAYENYVERLNRLRKEKNLMAYKENTKPGSGNFFVRNKSNPRLLDQVLITDVNEVKKKESINIKSLDKPLSSPHKFRMPINYDFNNNNNSVLNLKTKNRDFTNIEKSQEKLRITGPILYEDALNYLHRQLHSLNLEE